MRTLARLLAAAAALVVSVVLLPARADAYDEPYVASFRATSTRVVIASNSCRDIPYVVDFGGATDAEWMYAGGTTEVWKGSSNVGNDTFYDEITTTIRANGGYYWCPSLDGLGIFRFKLTQGEFSGWALGDSVDGTYATGQTASVTVKQAAQVVSLRVVRSGARRTATAKARYYSIGRASWTSLPRGAQVVLQRRSVGGSVWANVKTVTVGRSGAINTSWTADRVRDYRIVTRSTANTWNGTSVIVRR